METSSQNDHEDSDLVTVLDNEIIRGFLKNEICYAFDQPPEWPVDQQYVSFYDVLAAMHATVACSFGMFEGMLPTKIMHLTPQFYGCDFHVTFERDQPGVGSVTLGNLIKFIYLFRLCLQRKTGKPVIIRPREFVCDTDKVNYVSIKSDMIVVQICQESGMQTRAVFHWDNNEKVPPHCSMGIARVTWQHGVHYALNLVPK